MSIATLPQHAERLQQNLWSFEQKRFNVLMYCPMCEEQHENNTFCQANFNDDQGMMS